jgi:EAL domain-containing protein (putative c-di-GMP-specific phosphodiesterase class I)/GGDEF domain-containing protein
VKQTRLKQDYFLLRAEWLRFRNNLHDSGTELPTLAAVLDQARRLLEERAVLGLIYLDLSGNSHIETLYGWQAYDEVISNVGLTLTGLRGELLGPRDIVSVLSVRSDKFALFLEGDPARTLDEPALAATASRLRESLAAAVPQRTARFQPAGVYAGHCLLSRDPKLRTERAIHRALDAAVRESLRERAREEDASAQGLERIVEAEDLVLWYQPIVDLGDRSVLGHEVFTRGPAGGPFGNSERLFSVAERAGQLEALERLCRRRALASLGQHLPEGAKLFLNASATALQDPELAGGAFERQLETAGLRAGDVVLEFAERLAVESRPAQLDVLKELKRRGVGIAIDNMGAGYASLQTLVEVVPDFLKFDTALVRDIDRSQIKQGLLETLVELSEKIGARIIAEGVEEESELATLRQMGVRLGQGRHLAPPLPVGQ